jgi:hypothetical protein
LRIRICLVFAFCAVIARPQSPVLWEKRERPDLHAVGVSAPAPPFRFIAEDLQGRSPKIDVRDARGRLWSVKFGPEARAETFACRLVWAAGYYSDATYYFPEGRITRAPRLKRAQAHVDKTGSFRDARFEHRDESCRFDDAGWAWQRNPFVGTRELNGLKILVMLLSNWDHKDASGEDSNNGILECGRGDQRRRVYYVSDWGASLGRWGRKFIHNKWDCEAFASQTPTFLNVVSDQRLDFGFSSGRQSDEFKRGITLADVRWVVTLLRRIPHAQIRSALRASGATPHETEHFASALRSRVMALHQAAELKSRINAALMPAARQR